MGYFPNGTDGMFYQDEYCLKCIHYKEDDRGIGCPVWDLHILHNYDKEREIDLDLFIPRDGVRNKQCVMFVQDVTRETNKDQLRLEL